MKRPIVYFIPGLGADDRMYVYQKRLPIDARFLNWIPPYHKENLDAYVKRFARLVTFPKEPFYLVGTSLGGIMAIELSKYISPKKIIVLSTAKTRNELPWSIKALSYVPLHRLVSGNSYKKITQRVLFNFRRRKKSTYLRKTFRDMMLDTHPYFVQWAVDRLIFWNNMTYPDNLVHIHGTADRVFPITYIKNSIQIVGGTHGMVLDRARDINECLRKHIDM